MSYKAKAANPSRLFLGAQLLRAQRGEGSAREKLLIASGQYLSGIARQRIGRGLQSKLDASDVVQEAIVAAHRHFDEFRGSTEAEFAAWLRTILTARIANARRHFGARRRDARREQSLSSADGAVEHALGRWPAADASSPSEQAVARERTDGLVRAVESLPPQYRQVIALRSFEDLAFAEVAQRMGRTIDSVEKLWVRALKRLRVSLGGES